MCAHLCCHVPTALPCPYPPLLARDSHSHPPLCGWDFTKQDLNWKCDPSTVRRASAMLANPDSKTSSVCSVPSSLCPLFLLGSLGLLYLRLASFSSYCFSCSKRKKKIARLSPPPPVAHTRAVEWNNFQKWSDMAWSYDLLRPADVCPPLFHFKARQMISLCPLALISETH